MGDFVTIGKRLKEIRGSITQNDLGKEFGVSRSYIANIESGRTQPSLEYLIFNTNKFKVSLDWIIFGQLYESPKSNISFYKENPEEELELIFAYLRELWFSGDLDRRGWIKIQIKEAFPRFEAWKKKQLGIKDENTETGA